MSTGCLYTGQAIEGRNCACRKLGESPFILEFVITFGRSGCVALYSLIKFFALYAGFTPRVDAICRSRCVDNMKRAASKTGTYA